jgi:hypothetical protein
MIQIHHNGMVFRLLRKIVLIFAAIILTVTFFLTLQYYQMEIYHKEQNHPFEGNQFYNPYTKYTGKTLKANFHAHSAAWMNLTNGAQQPEDIYDFYKKNGYDIISLSNYQKITKDSSSSFYIPAYEHGYNLRKRHQLVINSEKENYFDFPVFQSFHNKQQVLNKLKTENNLVVLAHPDFMNGYVAEDMNYLSRYDLIEVFNYCGNSAGIWDASLSSGYPAWIIADDDCHNINNPNLVFNNWTRISSEGTSREAVIDALKKGCHYGVRNTNHNEINYLDSCTVSGNTIRVWFRTKPDKITFVSDNGKIRKEVSNSYFAEYSISDDDSYVRIEATTGNELIYLNPVIRYNGYQLTSNIGSPEVNIGLTLLCRLMVIIINSSNLFALLYLNPGFRSRIKLSRKRVKPRFTEVGVV